MTFDKNTGAPQSGIKALQYNPFTQRWSLQTAILDFTVWEGDPFDIEAAERIAEAILAGKGRYRAYDRDGNRIYVTIPEDD